MAEFGSKPSEKEWTLTGRKASAGGTAWISIEGPDLPRGERVRVVPVEDDPERIARAFHEAYERLAPTFGYETRPDSAVPWEEVPERNRALMIAVAREVLGCSGRPEKETG